MNVIETQNLTKYYGKDRGIIDLSLKIKTGEIFGFIDAGVLRPDYGLELWRVLYFLGLSLVLITITFVIYKKKDILI